MSDGVRVRSRIAELVSGLLGTDVGHDTNFFRAGGDSLFAARLVAGLRREIGLRCSISTVFRNPTLAELESALAGVADDAGRPEAPASAAIVGGAAAPALTYNQRRRLKRDLSNRQQGTPESNHVSYTAEIVGPFDTEAFGNAVAAVIERHDSLRLMVVSLDTVETKIATSAFRPLRTIDATGFSMGDLRAAVAAAQCVPFDLATEPKIRATVFATGQSRAIIDVTVEHLVCDGQSLGVLMRDLAFAYASCLLDEVPRWPAPAPTSRQIAEAETRRLEPDALGRDLTYWRERLDPQQPFPEFVIPGAVEPELGKRTRAVAQRTVHGLGARLISARKQLGATAYGFCATALLATMAATGHTESPGLMSPLDVRPAELDSAIGWFSQTTPIRVTINHQAAVSDLLADVGGALAEAMDRSIPLPLLLLHLQPDLLTRRAWHPRVFLDVDWFDESAGFAVDGLGVRPFETSEMALRDGLALVCCVVQEDVTLYAQYEAESLTPARAEAFIDAFVNGLESIIDDSHRTVESLLERVRSNPSD